MDNLLMNRKSVNLPIEDPVTNAVNAAKPLVDGLTDQERDSIELLIVGTESGLDFGKPISTYVADYLGLPRRCRSFETKHACYGGTAALQMAANTVRSSHDPNMLALVIAADAASAVARNTYWEPSQGAGAVALLVGRDRCVLELDHGANGFCSYEVMDTLRPRPDVEAGDSDLSLMSYMTCLEESFRHYSERVDGANLASGFSHLVLHTPFAGMVQAAHRRIMRRRHPEFDSGQILADFECRVEPSIRFCKEIGNTYSASLYLALCSLLQFCEFSQESRVGLFSYGSGCCSEFYSGIVGPGSNEAVTRWDIPGAIDRRVPLALDDYEVISDLAVERMAGVEDLKPDLTPYEEVYAEGFEGEGLLVLDQIKDYHREYRWS